ncbi:MAG: GntR family transcriptional regulator [bacterium]|nr:GntR family transcriptional regulator [bacterium]MCP5069969.1 GntR family transcriptional regulator [bacterium]
MSSLNTASPLPLYHQLAELLHGRIQAGEYPPGARIPSEPELARTFGIGRPTVRQATDVLIRRHCLERRRGSGTFVVVPPKQVDLLSLAGTMASFEKTGLDARTTIVQRARRVQVPEDPENPFAGRNAWSLVRLSRIAGTPVLLESLWLDPEHFPGLHKISLAGRSLSQLARDHFHLIAETADQNFRVALPDEAQRALLEVPPSAGLLLVKRRIHFPHARDAVFAELHCRTDQLVFSQTLGGPRND